MDPVSSNGDDALKETSGQLDHRSLILLSFSSMLALCSASGCNAPFWYAGPGLGGEEQAKKENKPQLLYFKTWDSTHHRNMGRKVFQDADVKKELADTVNIELEFAFFEEHAKRYGVTKSQVCVLCDPNGKKVGALYVNPVPPAPRFLQWLRRAKSEASPKTVSRPAKPATSSSE
ncbi:MAG: hypothetical protein MI923_28230 [Phycisphaerales bacterium]|nr:hypothetical protein [Phycisphaerales bacterium]